MEELVHMIGRRISCGEHSYTINAIDGIMVRCTQHLSRYTRNISIPWWSFFWKPDGDREKRFPMFKIYRPPRVFVERDDN